MNKYLYIYNYSPHEKNLCEMEFREIFQEQMCSKYYFTNQLFDYTRSVYIKGRLDIMMSSKCFDDIVTYLEKEELVYYDFKVIYLKNEITHIDYQESLEKCRMVALPIEGSCNFKEPQTLFAITCLDNCWYFGIYHSKPEWDKRYHKPHSYSHSLNNRDARTFVNIALGKDKTQTIVDPCCGIGTVVLEALSMGACIKGYDINRDVSYKARQNLEHFGYDPLIIERRDMHDIHEFFDVAIMDIPYGIFSSVPYEEQLSLIQYIPYIAKRCVLITHKDFTKEIEKSHMKVNNKATIQKGSLTRHIYLCEKIL